MIPDPCALDGGFLEGLSQCIFAIVNRVVTVQGEGFMSGDKVERKVAVILATDVVGYSTKIEQNETQTLQTLVICMA